MNVSSTDIGVSIIFTVVEAIAKVISIYVWLVWVLLLEHIFVNFTLGVGLVGFHELVIFRYVLVFVNHDPPLKLVVIFFWNNLEHYAEHEY